MKLVDEIRADKAKHPRLYEEAAKGYRNFTELADRAGVSPGTVQRRVNKGWIPRPSQPKSNNNHLANATKMMNNTDPSPHIPPKQQDTTNKTSRKPMSIPEEYIANHGNVVVYWKDYYLEYGSPDDDKEWLETEFHFSCKGFEAMTFKERCEYLGLVSAVVEEQRWPWKRFQDPKYHKKVIWNKVRRLPSEEQDDELYRLKLDLEKYFRDHDGYEYMWPDERSQYAGLMAGAINRHHDLQVNNTQVPDQLRKEFADQLRKEFADQVSAREAKMVYP